MKITDTKIVIEAADLLSFSDQLRADIIFRAGPANDPAEYLAGRFNAILEECTHIHKAERVKQNEHVVHAFGTADKATQNSIKTILGLEVSPEDAARAAADETKDTSLLGKLKNLFS